MTRPLQGLPKPHAGPLPGAWGGYITAKDPAGYTVSIPTLLGQGEQPNCEAVGVYAVGDPVWVISIEGKRDRFLIFAARQR